MNGLNYKVDIVGSFLPPDNLREAMNNFYAGRIGRDELTAVEDRAVDDLVECQLEAGLREITSGEYRRQYWNLDFWFGFQGISHERRENGSLYEDLRPFVDYMRFIGRIGYNPEHPFFDDYVYLQERAAGRAACRQTIPSPANLYMAMYDMTAGHPENIYPAPESLLDDIARAYNATIRRFYDLGCRHLQLDDTACGLMCEFESQERLIQNGVDINVLMNQMIRLINDSLLDLPEDMEISMYLSSGDHVVPLWRYQRQPFHLMPRLFNESRVNKFFMPFRLGQEDQFEVLRFMPESKKVVIGLVDAHTPFPADPYLISRSVGMAADRFPAENISISPLTGFKISSYEERGLSYNDQWSILSQMR